MKFTIYLLLTELENSSILFYPLISLLKETVPLPIQNYWINHAYFYLWTQSCIYFNLSTEIRSSKRLLGVISSRQNFQSIRGLVNKNKKNTKQERAQRIAEQTEVVIDKKDGTYKCLKEPVNSSEVANGQVYHS